MWGIFESLADTAAIPKVTELSSIIEENIPEKEDGAGSCFLLKSRKFFVFKRDHLAPSKISF